MRCRLPSGEEITYEPKPIATEKVSLSSWLVELTEVLAENAHENWAALRIEEGWTWGPQRDDAAKTNPCLVPYEHLTEGEKEYDRKTAIETVRMLVAMGYVIRRKGIYHRGDSRKPDPEPPPMPDPENPT